ncbi:uncharacterized protein LOC122738973 [Dromiciops gliroides]|uniref:uncharacterized protein LOC122738973 n=1 Tax=Dromiciops gliroides TaxID=33562 RepID=UPI001CC59A07|nr:uncharacterized protein LOC122738973 [Dromiciops gliroides]
MYTVRLILLRDELESSPTPPPAGLYSTTETQQETDPEANTETNKSARPSSSAQAPQRDTASVSKEKESPADKSRENATTVPVMMNPSAGTVALRSGGGGGGGGSHSDSSSSSSGNSGVQYVQTAMPVQTHLHTAAAGKTGGGRQLLLQCTRAAWALCWGGGGAGRRAQGRARRGRGLHSSPRLPQLIKLQLPAAANQPRAQRNQLDICGDCLHCTAPALNVPSHGSAKMQLPYWRPLHLFWQMHMQRLQMCFLPERRLLFLLPCWVSQVFQGVCQQRERQGQLLPLRDLLVSCKSNHPLLEA